MSDKLSARIEIIGINPFVYLPESILTEIFNQAGKEKDIYLLKEQSITFHISRHWLNLVVPGDFILMQKCLKIHLKEWENK